MAVVSQQPLSKGRPNRGGLTGLGEENSLGHEVDQHWQVFVPFALVHLVGSLRDHVV